MKMPSQKQTPANTALKLVDPFVTFAVDFMDNSNADKAPFLNLPTVQPVTSLYAGKLLN